MDSCPHPKWDLWVYIGVSTWATVPPGTFELMLAPTQGPSSISGWDSDLEGWCFNDLKVLVRIGTLEWMPLLLKSSTLGCWLGSWGPHDVQGLHFDCWGLGSWYPYLLKRPMWESDFWVDVLINSKVKLGGGAKNWSLHGLQSPNWGLNLVVDGTPMKVYRSTGTFKLVVLSMTQSLDSEWDFGADYGLF